MHPTRRRAAVAVRTLRAIVVLAAVATLAGCWARSPQALYDQAEAKAKHDDISGSIIDLKNALEKDPDFGPARHLLGQHYLRMGDPLSALKELLRAQKLKQAPASIGDEILRAQIDGGQFSEALATIGKLNSASMGAETWALRGEALLETQDYPHAMSAVGTALARDPNNADAHLAAARLAWAANDASTATREFAAAVRLAPDSIRAWLNKGDYELAAGHLVAASATFQAALSKSQGIDRSRARTGLARVALSAGDYDAADGYLKLVLKQMPDLPMGHYLAGMTDFRRGRWDAAEDHLLQVLKRAPNHLPTLLLKGAVNAEQKKWLQAESALSQVLAAAPTDLRPRKLLANIYMRQQAPDKAVKVLMDAASSGAGDAQFQSLLASALMSNGQAGKAVELMQKATAATPDTPALRTQLAMSRLASGDAVAAERDLRAASVMKDANQSTQNLLVLVLLRDEHFDEALVEIDKMKKAQPKEPGNFNMAAAAWLGKKDIAKAEAELQAALALDPKYTPALLNLGKIATDRKDLAAGARWFTQAHKLEPANIEATTGLAVVEMQSHHEKEALALLETAVKQDPNAMQPRLMLAQHYFETRQYALAEVPAHEALSLQPNNVAAASFYAKALLGQGKTQLALDVLERVVPKAATDPSMLYDLAWARASMGNVQGGSEAAQKAVIYSQGRSVPPLQLAARLALTRGDFAGASKTIGALRAALGKTSDPAMVINLAELDGDVALGQKRYPAAIANYTKVLAARADAAVLVRLASALAGSGRPQEAIDKLRAWLTTRPDDVRTRQHLADTLTGLGQSAAATSELETLLKFDPTNAVAHNNLAWLYLGAKDTARALQQSEQALAAAPTNLDVMDTAAWMRYSVGKKDGVVDLLKRAAANKKPEVRYHLAAALFAQGQKDAARKELDALLAGQPEFAGRADAVALRGRL